MSFKVLPAEIINVINDFSGNNALIEWKDWRKWCENNIINYNMIMAKHAIKSQGNTRSNDGMIFLSWIEGLSFAHTVNEPYEKFICYMIDKILRNEDIDCALNTINCTLSVLAKTDAPRSMQVAVRCIISAFLFDYSEDDEPNVFHLISNTHESIAESPSDLEIYFAHIHYYTPYDSPELAQWQMERFDSNERVTIVRNGSHHPTNVIDLSKCPFPIDVTDAQIRTYLSISRPQNDVDYINDKKINERDLFFENHIHMILFNFVRSLYGKYGEPYNNPLSAFSPYYRYTEIDECSEYSINIHSNEFLRHNVPERYANMNHYYMLVSLLLGKRRNDFLNMTYYKIPSLCLDLRIINKIIVPVPHRGTIKYTFKDNIIVPTFTELIKCPLFYKYVKLYWQYNDVIKSYEFDDYQILDNAYRVKPKIKKKLLHYDNPKFAQTLFDESMDKDKAITEYVLKHVFSYLNDDK